MMRDWMDVMRKREVLIPIGGDETLFPSRGGAFLIADSETDPTLIVKFGAENRPVRLIANEAGVLVASPLARVRENLGIDPHKAIIEPLREASDMGLNHLILCVNLNSLAGPMCSMGMVEMIDHMMLAGNWIRQRVSNLKILYVVHVPQAGGRWTNLLAEQVTWQKFYTMYEIEVLGRRDDSVDYDVSRHGENTHGIFG